MTEYPQPLSERCFHRIWSAADATGGPLDEVFALVRSAVPEVEVRRLDARGRGEDDHVWWLVTPDRREAQVDTAAGGHAPFHLDVDTERRDVKEVAEAARLLTAFLRA
ncbi:hypothetical protein GCM10020229_55120 [Kitasatospora albolonga]|uniref:hypothetical protein n=1 Tax=Kitasatospora albolonga TaxID=68173 RepID=UPI0031EA2083